MKVYKLRKNKPKPARQWLKSGAGQSSVKQNTKDLVKVVIKIVIFMEKASMG